MGEGRKGWGATRVLLILGSPPRELLQGFLKPIRPKNTHSEFAQCNKKFVLASVASGLSLLLGLLVAVSAEHRPLSGRLGVTKS